MPAILVGLVNLVSAYFSGIRLVAGSAGGVIYVERFRMLTGESIEFSDGTTRHEVCAGTYCGLIIKGGVCILDVADGATMVSYDYGDTWVDRTEG